jgi:thiol-disulfide isomerase/thioredoxin
MRSVIGRFGTAGLVLAAGLAAGCGKDCPTSPAAAGGTPPPDRAADAMGVTVSVVKYPDLEEVVASQKGRVVLVDFWATFCAPCKKKFPYVVELHEKYADKGLTCVSVSLDDVEEKDAAHKFLAEHRAAFPNVLIKPSSAEEKLMEKKFGYDGTLPQMAIFAKTGERVWDSNSTPIREKELKAYAAKLEEMVVAELAKK